LRRRHRVHHSAEVHSRMAGLKAPIAGPALLAIIAEPQEGDSWLVAQKFVHKCSRHVALAPHKSVRQVSHVCPRAYHCLVAARGAEANANDSVGLIDERAGAALEKDTGSGHNATHTPLAEASRRLLRKCRKSVRSSYAACAAGC